MHAQNIVHLGVKELWSLARDPMMLLLIAYAFTLSIYSTSTALPDTLHNAPIAIVDEDQSPLSQRIVNAFQGAVVPAADHGVAGEDGRPDGRRT